MMGSLLGSIAAGHRWLPVRNDTGEELLAWSPVMANGFFTHEGRIGVKAVKANDSWRPFYPIIGPEDIEVNGVGMCTLDIGKPILLNHIPAGSACNEGNRVFGMTANSFACQPDGLGFKSLGTRTPEGFLLAFQYPYHLIPVRGTGEVYSTRNQPTGLYLNAPSFNWGSDGRSAGSIDDDHFVVCYDSGLGDTSRLDGKWFGGERT